MMQFFTGNSRNTQSKSYTLSLTECVCEFRNHLRILFNMQYFFYFVVLSQGQATDVLPCDVLLPEELPSKIQGVPGELQYISVKSRLLDMGVALRGE